MCSRRESPKSKFSGTTCSSGFSASRAISDSRLLDLAKLGVPRCLNAGSRVHGGSVRLLLDSVARSLFKRPWSPRSDLYPAHAVLLGWFLA
jgi:hypothetical protein